MVAGVKIRIVGETHMQALARLDRVDIDGVHMQRRCWRDLEGREPMEDCHPPNHSLPVREYTHARPPMTMSVIVSIFFPESPAIERQCHILDQHRVRFVPC